MSFFTINHNHEREPFFTFSVQEINIWGLAVVHESTYGFFAPSIAFWIQCLSVSIGADHFKKDCSCERNGEKFGFPCN